MDPQVELRIEAGEAPGRRFGLAPGRTLVLGRGDDVDVPIRDPDASRRHASVELGPQGVSVVDLGSKNGTHLDGVPLTPFEPRRVTEGVIGIGAHRIRIERVGGRLRDLYELTGELGRGGAGVVFRARHRASGREVAVKSLAPQAGAGAAVRERFLGEGRLRIDSPYVVQVYDLLVEGDQVHLVMELVPGEPLVRRLERDGPLPVRAAVVLGGQLASALEAAHALGVVHRDVKPHNVLLAPDGRAKLGDFGIAKLPGASYTITGTGMGTLQYMAPEQARDAKRVSPASDLYGLGATLYHVLAGAPPFADGPRLVEQLLEDEPPQLQRRRPDCPRPLGKLVHALLEKDPRDRPASAAAVRQELLPLLGGPA